ncbi:hypothetical protein Tco_1319321 [Tanacetum coccineum]
MDEDRVSVRQNHERESLHNLGDPLNHHRQQKHEIGRGEPPHVTLIRKLKENKNTGLKTLSLFLDENGSEVSSAGERGSLMNEMENSFSDRNLLDWTLIDIPGSKVLSGTRMTNTIVITPVNVTGAPVTNTVANHAEKPEKFNGHNFKRWQQKMFVYLTTLNLARFLNEKEIRKSSRIDDEVVQDQRQQDDNDLQDERQDQPKEEEVEPRKSKRERTEKSFGPDFVSFMVENEPISYREVGFAAVLAGLVARASQSRQHVGTSLIRIESCKSPTAELFEVDSGRISIRHCKY